jgi:hypothetical protein
MERFNGRGALAVDFHECVEREFYVHALPVSWLDGVGESITRCFDRRYLLCGLSSYHRIADPGFGNFDHNHDIRDGAPHLSAHAGRLGFARWLIAEFMGNSDFTPSQAVGRTDAAATLAEQMVGGVLGRTIYNHRCGDFTATLHFPELPPDELIEAMVIAADRKEICRRSSFLAGDGHEEILGPGERVIAVRRQFQPECRKP